MGDKKNVPKIIWQAFFGSHLIIAYVALKVLHKPDVPPTEDMLQYVLMGAGFFVTFAALFVKKMSESKKSFEEFFTLFILSIAMSEAVHIFGLLSIILGCDINYYYGFLIGGVTLHLYMSPKVERFK